MTQATNATAGQILTHNGRPILAMYHGNGGGRTESYKLLYGDGVSDPHPYLASVAYPHANPKTWERQLNTTELTNALRAGGIAVPGTVTGIEIISRGLSPRVRTLRITGTAGSVETTGLKFQNALDLPSAWFDIRIGDVAPVLLQAPEADTAMTTDDAAPVLAAGATSTPTRPQRRLALFALALAALALASASLRRGTFKA